MKREIWKVVGLLSIIVFMLSTAASAHAATLTTVIPSSTIDQTAVVYANGYIFVASYFGDNVEVISDTTNTQIASLQVPLGAPYGLAYDSVKGEIWIATSGGACAISDSPPFNSVVNVTDSIGFVQAAFDAKTGEVFMSFNGPIIVISDSSNTVIANITQSVTGIVDDSDKSEIFASQYLDESGLSSGNVYVISAKTNTITATIPVTGVPGGLVYDSGKGEIFVAVGSTIQVISDSTNKVVDTINLQAGMMAYNPNKGEIYSSTGSSLAIISDKTNGVVETVNINGTLSYAGGLAYDSGTSTIYAVNSEGSETGTLGSVAVISDPSSSSSSSSPASTPTSSTSTGTSASASPATSPTVPEFSGVALVSVAAVLAIVTMCAVALTVRKRKQLRT